MKPLLVEFATYNHWANHQLTNCILGLDPAGFTTIIPSSFPSVHATLLHLWDADSIWWQRLNQEGKIKVPSKSFQGNTSEVVTHLLVQNLAFGDWVNDLPAEAFDEAFVYTNSRGEQFRQPLYQVVLHICNHGSYHRGQLVTLLHHLKVENIPATDFVHWARTEFS